MLGVDFPIPLIQSNFLGTVGDTSGRSRLDPNLQVANLAVSGATVGSLLREQADGITDSEVDLVLSPYLGTQIEVAESLSPLLVICWVGSNDVLSAATTFSQLDASQLTPVSEFKADFSELALRLATKGQPVIFGNIPGIDQIGFLVSRDDLVAFTGSDYGLPPGSLTSVVELLLLMAGLDDGSNLQDPGYVLDPGEIAAIQNHTATLNLIIQYVAEFFGYPVVDINSQFAALQTSPPVIGGQVLTTQYLGGLFSLDGVHPSNVGHALIANAFIEKLNDHYQTSFTTIPEASLNEIALSDPFIDKDGDGSIPGRPFTSLLETVAVLAGVSGDSNDAVAQDAQPINSEEFLNSVRKLRIQSDPRSLERGPGSTPKAEVTELLRKAFGLERHRTNR